MIPRSVSRAAFALAIAATLAGCGGDDGKDGAAGTNGTNGTNGRSGLLAISPEPAGANCAAGGSRVHSGLDANANNTLDTAEITNTQYVCNASAGISSLVELNDEAPGANCPSGGKQFNAGLDTNSNGVLDASEVTSSGYVCNGEAGTAGVNSLTAMVSEPAGGICAVGGVKLTSGPDADRNGVLDASEVTATQYVCNGSSGSLISTTVEVAGLNCPNGGTRISSGLDGNGNGTLDSFEITASAYACNGAPGPSFAWENVTGTFAQAVPNRGYLANSSSSEVTIMLPTSAALGDVVKVSGLGTRGWRIAQNAGQSVVTRHLPGEVGKVWTVKPQVSGIVAIASSANGQRLVAPSPNNPIYISSDAGETWVPRGPSVRWSAVASSADGVNLVAGVYNGEVYTSADAGANWTARGNPGQWSTLASSADGKRLIGGLYNSPIKLSVDAGVTWTDALTPQTWMGVASSADGMRLVAGGDSTQLYVSLDGGETWNARGPTGYWTDIASSADGSRLIAASRGTGVFISTDAGYTWTQNPASLGFAFKVASSADGTRLYVAMEPAVLAVSLDGGATWFYAGDFGTWSGMATTADGTRAWALRGGMIYASVPATRPRSTVGATGSISGDQYDAITLQYSGPDEYSVLDFAGVFIVR